MTGLPHAAAGAALLLAVGCSQPNATGDAERPHNGGARASAAAADTLLEYRGVVTQGAQGLPAPTFLRQAGGASPVPLAGDLESELARLAGATVRVRGHWTASRGGALDVLDYRILEVDGEEPRVGTVVDRAGTLWLHTDDGEWRLAGAPPELTRSRGAYVWVVGEAAGAELRIRAYGIIRP